MWIAVLAVLGAVSITALGVLLLAIREFVKLTRETGWQQQEAAERALMTVKMNSERALDIIRARTLQEVQIVEEERAKSDINIQMYRDAIAKETAQIEAEQPPKPRVYRDILGREFQPHEVEIL
jgi:hypothetical protein